MVKFRDDPPVDEEAILKIPLSECSEEQVRLRAEILEKRLAKVQSSLPADLRGLKPTDRVEITMPLAPDGSLYTINDKPYYGKIVVELQTARQLLSMVSEASRVERDRLRERKGPTDSTIYRGDDQLKLQRYKEIMGENNA